MILAPLLFAAVVGFAPMQSKTLYQQVVPRADAANGYIDYVRAADIVRQADIDLYLNWSPRQYDDLLAVKQDAAQGEWTPDMEVRLARYQKLRDMDFLSIQRRAISECGAAFELIRAGNQKRAWDPRDKLDVNTMFPELASFKALAKLFRADAYVRFADGDSPGGTSDLIDGLTFAHHIGGMNIISELVSIACRSIVLAGFEEHLPQLCEKDAAQIVRYADSVLSEPTSYAQALERDRNATLASLDFILSSPESAFGGAQGEEGELGKYVKAMSSREREMTRAAFVKGFSAVYDKLLTRVGQDESTWADKPDELPAAPKSFSSPQDVADILVDIMMPVHQQVTEAVLKARAQLRLLDLHARIIGYRWHNNRLPGDLKEVAVEQLWRDPIAKSAFVYELRDGGYKLYSKGLASTGPIELRYRRAANPGKQDDDIPPASIP